MIAAYLKPQPQHCKQDRLGDSTAGNDAATRGLTEEARVCLRCRCAFIKQGICLIHRCDHWPAGVTALPQQTRFVSMRPLAGV